MYVQMCVAGGGVRWGMGREREMWEKEEGLERML